MSNKFWFICIYINQQFVVFLKLIYKIVEYICLLDDVFPLCLFTKKLMELTCWFGSDKEGLDDIAAAKIEKLTAELQEQEQDHEECDPVERIKDGFIHFKIHHFEYDGTISIKKLSIPKSIHE